MIVIPLHFVLQFLHKSARDLILMARILTVGYTAHSGLQVVLLLRGLEKGLLL